MAEAKELMDKLKSLKSNSDTYKAKIRKGMVAGTLIGAGGGLLIAYTKGYSLLASAFVGSILGGMASYLLLPKEEEDEE